MKKYILNLLLVASVSLAAGTMAFAQKKPLDHDAYDSWESASVVNVSKDGNLIVYMVGPQQGDAKLYLKNIATGQELVIDRGSAFAMPKDESYGVCTIAAPYAETRQAKIDKKKPEEMPADSVAYINLKTFEVVKVANAKSAKLGQDAAPYIFVNQEIKGKNAVKRLLVIDTKDGSVDTLKNISNFVLSRTGVLADSRYPSFQCGSYWRTFISCYIKSRVKAPFTRNRVGTVAEVGGVPTVFYGTQKLVRHNKGSKACVLRCLVYGDILAADSAVRAFV